MSNLEMYDHLTPEEAVYQAWTSPAHPMRRADVEAAMPGLAKALDRFAKDREPPKSRITALLKPGSRCVTCGEIVEDIEQIHQPDRFGNMWSGDSLHHLVVQPCGHLLRGTLRWHMDEDEKITSVELLESE